MKKTALLAIVVAFVFFSGKAAVAGAFGNDNLEITLDQELVVRAALGEQVVVRVKVAESIPLPPTQIPATSAPVAQAPVNYQPQQPIVDPFGPAVQAVPPVIPPTQMARPPADPPAVQPRQPETRVASAPPAKPAAPVAVTPAPAKPATSVNREPQAKAEPTLKPDKEVRKFRAMQMPIERLPQQFDLPNGKLFKKVNGELYEVTGGSYRHVGNTPWLVSEFVNGTENTAGITFMNAPPPGAEKELLKS